MSETEYETLQKGVQCDKSVVIDEETLAAELCQGEFIIDSNLDELKLINYELNESRFSRRSLSLTIAPTSNCNFACPYCYEKNSINCIKMTEKVQTNLLLHIEKVLLQTKAASLCVTWYGGEPLLTPEIIQSLSDQIIFLCKKLNVTYISGIVTNGYLIDDDTQQLFDNSLIRSMQVTLDGDQSFHDKRRFLRNGGETFEVILSNIKKLKQTSNISICIRVNIDSTNKSSYKNLLQTIKENDLMNKVNIYPAFVYNGHKLYSDEICYTPEQYCEIELDFYKTMLEKGFYVDHNNFIPRVIRACCGADKMSAYVINADGCVYKCWEEMGNKKFCIGNINEDRFIFTEHSLKYITYDPTSDEKCKNCKILPVCMGGGCPCHCNQRPDLKCTKHKFNLEKYLQFAAYIKSINSNS